MIYKFRNLISEEYKALNMRLHETNQNYGKSGVLYARDVMDLCFKNETEDVLDYGCGKSTLAANLPFTIKQYDPAVEVYSTLPNPADVVVCTDVLEHIEPDCIDEVIDHLAYLTKKVLFIMVANGPAFKFLEDGRNAHLIQQSDAWWHSKIAGYLDVVSYTKRGSEVRKDGNLFEEYAFIAKPYPYEETKDEQV